MSILALALAVAPLPQKPSLRAPDGFAVDLVAQAPEILWPSANLCLDDGSLLVGEDRMDMPGPSDQPLDRLIRLRFRPDGTVEKQVFADGLNAVFGLELVEGAVYVMNMPYLTRLVDRDGDGVADERTQILSDLGPPAPGFPGGFNDHIVSGIRLGHDGWIYIAVGDKGIPHAHGSDGSELTLRGGGVVRVRPDGSQLELVASGLRNILDVAIDERGEMFTHDNTDDGLGWWTRLSHIVPGGYYGYPWDYHEHAERMLPCMKDYGGGSPTGGLCYRESAWPAPYAGSLFFCEWARQKLRRFEVEEQGATFRVVKDEDFLEAGEVQEFRPVDVCESPDGRFLYVSDWGFGGWKDPAQCGRIWRVRRADDDPRRPSTLAALPEDVEGLVATLDDPSYRRRLRAQQALGARVRADAELCKQLVPSLEHGSPRAQRHALWALVEAAPERARAFDQRVLRIPDETLRREYLRAVASHPHELLPLVTELLDTSTDPVLQRLEIAAFRRGWTETALVNPDDAQAVAMTQTFVRLTGNGTGSDPWVAWLATQLLKEIGYRPKLEQHELATEIYRDGYDLESLRVLRDVSASRIESPPRVLWAIDLLAGLARKPAPWDGKWWGTQPASHPPAAHSLDWPGTAEALRAIRACFTHRRQDVRAAAYEAALRVPDRDAAPELRARYSAEQDPELKLRLLAILGELKDEGCAALLRTVLSDAQADPRLRAQALETACAVRSAATLELLAGIARDPRTSGEQAAACLRALGRFAEPACVAATTELLGDARPLVAPAAVAALVQQKGQDSLALLEPLLARPDLETRKAVLRAWRKLAPPGKTDALLAAWKDKGTRVEAALALCARPDARALDAYLELAAGGDLDGQKAARTALSALREELRPELESRARPHALAPPALELLRAIYVDPAPLCDWELCGPFPRGQAAPEAPWKSWRAREKDGFVDLEKALASKSEVCAFARTHVSSSRARKAQMRAGSDDMLTVWVNGKLVHDKQVDRSWREDEDVFDVELVAGANEILLRIGQASGQWSFNAKLAGEGGGPLFAEPLAADPLAELRAWVLAHPGVAARGERVFRESQDKAMCVRCHKAGGAGGAVGPDLSDVGAKYPKAELLDSILHPSQRILDGYKVAWLELDDGRTLFGLVKGEEGGELLLYDLQGQLVRVEKSSVSERGTNERSAMPDGLEKLLTREELADLVAWLESLKGPAR